jgi:hypothetical protein
MDGREDPAGWNGVAHGVGEPGEPAAEWNVIVLPRMEGDDRRERERRPSNDSWTAFNGMVFISVGITFLAVAVGYVGHKIGNIGDVSQSIEHASDSIKTVGASITNVSAIWEDCKKIRLECRRINFFEGIKCEIVTKR